MNDCAHGNRPSECPQCDAETHPHFECFAWNWRCLPVRGKTLREVIDNAIDAVRAQEKQS